MQQKREIIRKMEQIGLNLEKHRSEILEELGTLNKRILDAINFRIIHALMKAEIPILKDTEAKLSEYKKERWQKALEQAKGNKKEAYKLLASEEFY